MSEDSRFEIPPFFLACSPPSVTIIPGTSNLSLPIEYQRNEDLYISSNIELNCEKSFGTQWKWLINNCSISNCTNAFPVDLTSIITTGHELYIPAQILSFGVYELKFTIGMNISANFTTTKSTFVRITLSGITANLLSFGTSMITSGSGQDLELNPGLYSVDLDEDQFNARDWNYQYYCRIYGFFNFPRTQNIFIPFDDPRLDPLNQSCLSNRSGTEKSFLILNVADVHPVCRKWILVAMEISRCARFIEIFFGDSVRFTSSK